MSIAKDILRVFSNYPGGYGMLYEVLYNEKPNVKYKESTVKNTISRLKKQGLLSNKNNKWQVTTLGREILYKRNSSVNSFINPRLNKKQKKSMMLVFDIPEKKRKYRDWLRYELMSFGFEMIQKSVWFGPTLPKDFINYLNETKLLQYIKFFKVQESNII